VDPDPHQMVRIRLLRIRIHHLSHANPDPDLKKQRVNNLSCDFQTGSRFIFKKN